MGHWLGLQAQCLALASSLAILGTIPGLGAEASRPGAADRCSGAGCAEPPARGVTVYRGLVLDYEVIDGMAVHGGDIVLGTAAAAAAAAPSRQPAEPERSEGPARRDIAGVSSASSLWPGGRAPYEIDDGVESALRERIHAAIEEWNAKTVISLFPRTDEPSYVRFEMVDSGRPCSAFVGYFTNSPTKVFLPPNCGTNGVLHEIGHAVGLFHEHQRPDRDSFIAVPTDSLQLGLGSTWAAHAGDRVSGPYDYRSIMHYPSARAISIPRGIPAGFTGALSAGDIDGVARLYGKPPETVTVSTNPPGLEVLVDGESVTAPATFAWLADSVHTLAAPVLGDLGSRPHVFGRWNDGGNRERTVKVAGSTWFEANYIPLARVRGEVSPRDAGAIALHPESPDGWYPRGSPVDATITATGPPAQVHADYRVGEMAAGIHPFHDRTIIARYLVPPLYGISSNPAGLEFELNGRRWQTPVAFQPSQLPAGSKVSVPEFVRDAGPPIGAEGRYRFSGWSDGGEREHEIEVPARGGSLRLEVQREFELVTHATGGGELVVSPVSEDGFHPSGTQVQLTAVPEAGQYFVGWEHDLAGTETRRTVIMDRDRLAVARFSAAKPVLAPFGEPLPAESLTGRHFVRVPDGTSAVAVRFESSSTARDAAFYVTDGAGRRELGATRLRQSDTIRLTRETLSRMRDKARLNPSYDSHHLLIRQRGGSTWSGQLHVSIQRDWIGGVWPPAFTFVSSAGWSRPLRQTLRVASVEGPIPPVRYRIVSDSHWLEAFPPEWTGGQGEAEIAVTANGAALGAEAYGGKLKILIDRGGDPAEGWTPTGIEIPVHFVVKPADGAGEPTGDGSTGLVGGDDHGDARSAATELAAGAATPGRLERVGDADWFRFRTTAAHTWVTAYTVSDGDTAGELHVAGGRTVTDDDSGSGANFRITAGVPAGTHYLRVSGSGTADYTLTLQETPDAMEFVRIPAGSFVMGSPEDEQGRRDREGPQREVRISQDFWMGKYEVTQGEWEAVMGSNPSYNKDCGSRCPVENVSWDDTQEFIRKLNERETGSGQVYRLPTEAEWEYAARAGTTGARHGALDEIAWYRDNSDLTAHPVGHKRANAWGLHDMLGNVLEWTADWYGAYASGKVTDPAGPSTGSQRVYRGGTWAEHARYIRSADRLKNSPGFRFPTVGFRLVRTN